MMEDAQRFISAVGFPIFVAVYFLIYTERAMRNLTKIIQALCLAQTTHIEDSKVHHQRHNHGKNHPD